jgi:hypothetical protein
LPRDHWIVRDELKRQRSASLPESDAQPATPVGATLASPQGQAQPSWQRFHEQFFDSKRVTWRHVRAPDDIRSSPWYELLPCREQEVLAYHAAECNSDADELLGVDTSERIDRAPLSKKGRFSSIKPNSRIYLVPNWAIGRRCNRMLLGHDALALQGFPVEWARHALSGVRPSDSELLDLAGNASTCSIMQALLIASLFVVGDDVERCEPK